jgi:uncharacterized membrane protein
MDKNRDSLLCELDDEIDKKCFEIKQRNRNRMLQSTFISGCVMFMIVPMMLVLIGVNLWAFCIPAILFLIVGFCFLSPLVFNNRLGGLER